MTKTKLLATILMLGAAPLAGELAFAAGTNAKKTTTTTTTTEQTAESQATGSQADVDITTRIRNQIVNNSGLSVSAQNVQIVTQGGQVTLKGTVASAAEKSTIEQIAVGVVGAGKVVNQTTISR